MSKPMNKTAARFTSKSDQKLEALHQSIATAIRLGQNERAEKLAAERDELIAAREARKVAVAARTEARRAAARESWYRQQMALAQVKK
jgi:RNA-binding protein YhbY